MTVSFNPFDEAQVDNDTDVLNTLRNEGPVHEVDGGFWLVTRYKDVNDILLDPVTFPQFGFRPAGTDKIPFEELQMVETDPPVHTEVRKPMAHAMTPKMVRHYEPTIREVAARLVEKLRSRSSADFIAEFAVPLPVEVTGMLAGIPEEQWPQIREYTDNVVKAQFQVDTTEGKEAAKRLVEFDDYFLEIIRHRKEHPKTGTPDVLDALLSSTDSEGKPISERRVLKEFSVDVIAGGIETTTHAIGNLMFHLLTHDGMYQQVREHPGLRDTVIEESIRVLPTLNYVMRKTAKLVEIDGVPVPKGVCLVLSLSSANHDERKYECPAQFDPGRAKDNPLKARDHLGFGRGVHVCVGAPLARLEIRCALDAVLDGIPTMEIDPGEVYERVPFFLIRGPRHLKINLPAAWATRAPGSGAEVIPENRS
jgi:cytochrome P450